MRFGDKNSQFPQVKVISTGSLALDHALGASCGVPWSCMVYTNTHPGGVAHTAHTLHTLK